MTILKETGLRSRLTKGLGAQGYSQAVQIAIRLVEVPLLLRFWGTQLYGEWLMLAAVPAYLSMCDVGFAGAASREMSMRSGAGDRVGALGVFQSTWLFLLAVSFGIGIFGLVALLGLPLQDWLGFREMGSDTARLVIVLFILHVLTGFQTGLAYGGFWCEGRYATGMALYTTLQLMEFGGLCIAVSLGGGPVAAASGYLGGRVAGLLLMRLGLYHSTPWLRYGWSRATVAEVKRLAAPAFASLAFPVGNALNIQGMVMIVGLVLGPPTVVVFSVLRTLSRFAMQPTMIVNRLIEPEMAAAYGRNLPDEFLRLFNRSCQAALWLSATSCIVLGISGKWLLGIWTHGKIAMDWALYTPLLAGVAINSIWYTALIAAYATNRHVSISLVYSSVYGGFAFVLALLLTKLAGVPGAGLSILATELAMAFLALPKMIRLVGESFQSWTNEITKPPWFLVQVKKNERVAHS